MQLQYIDENLNKIIQNLDSVLYLKPYNVGHKRALFAIVKEEQGVYRKVQITKEQSKMSFPWEPIYWFYQGPGYFYLKDFIVLNSNGLALNTANLEGFMYKELKDNKKQVGIFATFSDGSATFVIRENTKEFEQQNGIKTYMDLLKQYKEPKLNYNNYEIIEYYINSEDTFTIPKLKEKIKEQKNTSSILDNLGRKSAENIINDNPTFPDRVYKPNYYAFATDKEEKHEKGPTLIKRRKPTNPIEKK